MNQDGINWMVKILKPLSLILMLSLPASGSADERLERGKALAFDRNAGNCLSCHMIEGGELPGLIGPPLVQMQLRYPERSDLRAQIADAAKSNRTTVMPPYGRHSILTEMEIDLVVDFIHSL